MNRFAAAWVAALALSTATAAAQTSSSPARVRPPHQPRPIHSMQPIGRRSPRLVRTGRNGSPYQPYVMVPPAYVQSVLYPADVRPTPKPKPTPTSMYEIFSTIKNR